MTESQHLADTVRRACDGDAWHGPALKEVLRDVDAATARARKDDAHSIWEMTLHVMAWFDIVRRRMAGEVLGDHNLSASDDWPPMPDDVGEGRWNQTCDALIESAHRLAKAVEDFPTAKLDEQVPAKDYTYAVMLHGAAQHGLYHAGQMALLKKQLATGK
jgi:uncharacterized damage-inducible protein DinB